MVDMMLDFMLGPFRVIGDVYFEYQVIFNTLIVGFALYRIILGKKRSESNSK